MSIFAGLLKLLGLSILEGFLWNAPSDCHRLCASLDQNRPIPFMLYLTEGDGLDNWQVFLISGMGKELSVCPGSDHGPTQHPS